MFVQNGGIKNLSTLPFLLGRTAIVTGRTHIQNGTVERIRKILGVTDIAVIEVPRHEPDTETIDLLAQKVRDFKPTGIVALGGGTVMDTAKALSVLAVNPGEVSGYIEGVGTLAPLKAEPVPWVAVPTTAGTGSEATKNAVITVTSMQFKRSMRYDAMMAQAAVLDADLTLGLSDNVTAAGGFDALGQLIESFITKKANPYTDTLALYGIRLIAAHFAGAYEDPKNIEHRAAMQFAAYLSGHCLANSGLAMAHGFATGLGGRYPIPHGLVIGILLPHVMRFNSKEATAKLALVGEALTGKTHINEFEAAMKGASFVEALKEKMKVPRDFSGLSVSKSDIPGVVAASFGNSMSGNPTSLTEESAAAFLERLF